MNYSYDPTNLDLLETLRAKQKEEYIRGIKERKYDSFHKSLPDVPILFSELVELNGRLKPRDGCEYYIHPITFQTFSYSNFDSVWRDVTTDGNWKRVFETGSFLYM